MNKKHLIIYILFIGVGIFFFAPPVESGSGWIFDRSEPKTIGDLIVSLLFLVLGFLGLTFSIAFAKAEDDKRKGDSE